MYDAQYDIHASENEIAKDLQQLYQCSLAQVSQLLVTDTDPESKLANRSKVGDRQRKRTASARESDYLDAVLGLATLVSESDGPVVERKPKASIIKNAKPEPAPKAKPLVKPAQPPKTKPRPPPPATQRKPPAVSLSSAASYFPAYNYQFMNPYMLPIDKGGHPGLMMHNFPMTAAMGTGLPMGMFPPYSMMYPQGYYGKAQWPISAQQRSPVQAPVPAGNFKLKRAARHVAIAVFIREEEKQRKETSKASRLL